ncbi:NAD(P)-dependent oxidoreductase [Streptomyces jumonjinensis]|uniref:NAD(P)-dependent oxidoreductase n=1 Tax=Streptomyces jumonjinensis TaxID=1945 RepID=UPI0037B671CA
MGAAVAAQAVTAGHHVLWLPDGRSTATRDRAEQAGLTCCSSLGEALAASDVVLSICPPQAAEDVAHEVAGHRYQGVYVDANAISPQRMDRIARTIRPGTTVLDGAIFGPPPREGRTCRLYLAGDEHAATLVTQLFRGTPVDTRSAGETTGAASAVKMSFAHFQKTARTLAGVSHALADSHGVADLLTEEATRMTSEILSDPDYLPSVAARAWRWAPEMGEIATTLRDAGLPTDLAEAAATVMNRWKRDKDRADLPLAEALDHLRDTNP